MEDSRLVYSTETGRVCPKCGKPVSKCQCKRGKSKNQLQVPTDGIIRIKREVKGRKGKTATTISGFPGNQVDLKQIATELKNRCGTGGSVKDCIIIIQGDHRDIVREVLSKKGFKVKLAGG